MAWEKFTLTSKGSPKLTIRSGGQIGINESCVERYELAKYKYIVLLIDKDEKKIGIKFTNIENEEHSKPINFSKYGITIYAKNFVEFYGLDKIKKKKLDCIWDEAGQMLVASYAE